MNVSNVLSAKIIFFKKPIKKKKRVCDTALWHMEQMLSMNFYR